MKKRKAIVMMMAVLIIENGTGASNTLNVKAEGIETEATSEAGSKMGEKADSTVDFVELPQEYGEYVIYMNQENAENVDLPEQAWNSSCRHH